MEQDNQKDIELSAESSAEISLAEQMGLDASAAIELGLDDEEIAKLGLDIEEVHALKRKLEGAEHSDVFSTETDDVEEVSVVSENSAEEAYTEEGMHETDAVEGEGPETLEEMIEEPVKEITVCESEDVMPNIKEYMNNDSCNIVLAVTDKLLESSKDDEEMAEYLRGADLLIASSELKNTEEPVEGDGLDIHLITQIASEEEIGKISVMLMTEDRELAEKFEQKMHGLFEENGYLEFVGNYVVEPDTDDDSIINEINSALPDVLVSACKTPHQEKWLLENKSKMCAKLVIALSGEKEEFLQKKETGMGIISRIFGKLR